MNLRSHAVYALSAPGDRLDLAGPFVSAIVLTPGHIPKRVHQAVTLAHEDDVLCSMHKPTYGISRREACAYYCECLLR